MERIFISYKRVNVGHVEILKDKIEETLGVKCWFDLERIESGDQFPIELCDAIDNAEVVLFMHSYAHLGIDYKKDWTVKELSYAHKNDKKVVLVRLDDAPLKKIFLMNYDQSDIIDSRRPDQWEKLMKDLSRWLNLSAPKPKEYSDAELKDLNNKGDEFYDKKQYPELVEWYHKAAEQGNATVQAYLGNMYRNGYGVTKDYGEAVKWYRKAAEQGNAAAQYNMGLMYKNGFGVKKDLTQARYWYQKAADQGFEEAKMALARL